MQAKSPQSCLTLCNPLSGQIPLSMRFSRQEYWAGLSCPPPGDLPDPGIEPTTSFVSPTLAGRFLTTSTTWRDTYHTASQFKARCWPGFCWTAFPTLSFSVCCWSAWATQRLWSQLWRVQVQQQLHHHSHTLLLTVGGPSLQESVPRTPTVPSLRATHSASPAPGSILFISLHAEGPLVLQTSNAT